VRSSAAAARDDLRAVRADLDARALLEGDGAEDLARHADRFATIHRRLSSPLLAPVRVLPVVGRQLTAASQQADAAAAGLSEAAGLADEIGSLVDDGLGAGPERVATLQALAETARAGETTFEALELGPDEGLVGSLDAARREIESARMEVLDGLGRAASLGTGLADFFEGPNDYLLLAANNAQMQNGQGMFLSAGVLHVEGGRMDLGPMASLEKVPPVDPPVPLDPDLSARWGWLDPNDDVRHLGLSHRFPVTASTAAALWAALGNPPVDGVVAVDPLMLEAIMSATGPVRTAGGDLAGDEVVEHLLHDQYLGYLSGDADASYTTERRDALDEIAREVLSELEEVEDLDPDVVERFRVAAGGRHLLMWSPDPVVQQGFEAGGVDGRMGEGAVLLSLVNRSGVKLDWFMRATAELALAPTDAGYDATLEVALTNEAPARGEPRYVVGPYPGSGLEPGEYLGLVTLNLPAGATDGRFDDVDPLAVAGADGANRTVAAWVRVPRGETVRMTARFTLPAATAAVVVEPSARAHPTVWTYGGDRWPDRERRTIEP
jgi:hypothetical protein